MTGAWSPADGRPHRRTSIPPDEHIPATCCERNTLGPPGGDVRALASDDVDERAPFEGISSRRRRGDLWQNPES